MPFTAPTWTLQDIITETRGITGRPDASMMSDQQVANYINYFYQYVLPKEIKIFWGYTYYKFYAQPNVDQYTAPQDFQTLNPTVYADGWPLTWYLSPDDFYQDYPQQCNKMVVAQGNGTTNSFTFAIPAFPILPGSLYVTDGIQVAQDVPSNPYTGSGTFVDPNNNNAALPGSVNYSTGAVAGLGFASAPASNANITEASQTYNPNRPQGILFFKSQPLANSTSATLAAVNMFVLRPVPDNVYLIKMQGIQLPKPLINTTDVPFRMDLGPLIALGASLHIFKLFNQVDQYEQTMPEYNRFKDVCMQDTYEEYMYQRSVSKF